MGLRPTFGLGLNPLSEAGIGAQPHLLFDADGRPQAGLTSDGKAAASHL